MNAGGRQKVALVTPFFGRELRGRKERFAFAYATHLALEGVAIAEVAARRLFERRRAEPYLAGPAAAAVP